jgi:hypothetical protein
MSLGSWLITTPFPPLQLIYRGHNPPLALLLCLEFEIISVLSSLLAVLMTGTCDQTMIVG